MKQDIITLIKNEEITFKSLAEEVAFVQGFHCAKNVMVSPNIWISYMRGESILGVKYK